MTVLFVHACMVQAVEDELIVTPPPRDNKPAPPAVTPFAKHQLAAHKRYEAAVANGKAVKKDKKVGHRMHMYTYIYIYTYECI